MVHKKYSSKPCKFHKTNRYSKNNGTKTKIITLIKKNISMIPTSESRDVLKRRASSIKKTDNNLILKDRIYSKYISRICVSIFFIMVILNVFVEVYVNYYRHPFFSVDHLYLMWLKNMLICGEGSWPSVKHMLHIAVYSK